MMYSNLCLNSRETVPLKLLRTAPQDWKDTLKGRKVYVQLVITYRHGREEDETMGISFKKELIVDRAQVHI